MAISAPGHSKSEGAKYPPSTRGTKRFIRARVDTAPDIFFELFGQQSFSMIQERTLEEAKLQNDDEFQLSINELYAFVGLCIVRGVIKGRNEPLHSFWNTDYGRRIFTKTMSRNKFMKILRFIRFDDKRTRPRRRENDKYAPIRDLLETAMNNAEKSFFPYGGVTIDEQQFPCRSKCDIIQYMPQKPAKYGIKYWLLRDVKTSYVLRAITCVRNWIGLRSVLPSM